MDSCNDRNRHEGAGSAPFALIAAGGTTTLGDDAEMAAALRRMGLRPEAGDDASLLRLHFGAVTLCAGRADDAMLAIADPATPGTSMISHPLPPAWRNGGGCLTVLPSIDGRDAADGSARANALREFFKAMALLIDLFDASHFYWSAAQLWSDAGQLRAAVAEMLVSGMPPVLHLVAFRGDATGPTVRTCGLAHFAGQELVATGPPEWAMPQMTKRLARVALDMILNGAVRAERRYRGLDAGEWVQLTPQSADGERPARVVVAFHFDAD